MIFLVVILVIVVVILLVIAIVVILVFERGDPFSSLGIHTKRRRRR